MSEMTFGVVQDELPLLSASSLDPLIAALANFRAHAAVATAMVAALDHLIDRCATIPTEEWDRWGRAEALYRALRRGTVPRPLAPHVWRWRTDLRTAQYDAFPLLIRLRDAYSKLDGPSRSRATARLGAIHGGGIDFSPCWELGGWPTQGIRDLDTRAAVARLDIVPLMATNGALWSAAGIIDDTEVHKKRHGARRKHAAGVA